MNEQIIWDFLLKEFKNPIGTAAVMGNLFAESSLDPKNTTGLKKLGWTKDQYINYSDKGKHDFVNDGLAFGLVQWCYYSRKQGLLDLAKKKKTSIGNINTQLSYLVSEIKKYKTAYNAVINATNIREASDTVMLKYEKPANTSETMKVKRAKYSQQYFDKFAGVKVTATKDNLKELFNALKVKV